MSLDEPGPDERARAADTTTSLDDAPERPLSKRAQRRAAGKPRLTFWQELPLLIVIAIVLAVLLKTFAFQAFYIPSASMEATLYGDPTHGDRVMVNKLVYDFRDIKRGDIVVFEGSGLYDNPPYTTATPRNPIAKAAYKLGDLIGLTPKGTDYIKRVIGLPGDTVEADATGHVKINGVAINEPYMHTPTAPFAPVKVPAGHVFVMGDNRQDSQDSRYPKPGPIPENRIVGRAFAVIWPASHATWLSDPNVYGGVPKASALAPLAPAASAFPVGVSSLVVFGAAGLRRRRARR